MTYPQQQGWGQPPQQQFGQAPAQQQNGWGQPQPQQQFQQPQYAPPPQQQQYAPQQQQYGQPPPQQQYVPQQQNGWGQQPQQPQQQLAAGSLDDFYSQPSSGYGPAWSWKTAQPGTTYVGRVARPVTDADVEQNTAPNGGPPLWFRDGRPQLKMQVPMDVEPSQQFPEGKAQWYVAGQVRDELNRAMQMAGAPEGPPEAGAVIAVTLVGSRPNQYGGQTKQYSVQYQRPDGSTAAPQAPAQPQQQQFAPQQGQQFAPQQPQQQYAPPPQQQYQQPPAQAQPPQQYQPAAAAQGPQQQVPNPFGGQPLPLGQDNAALLAQLTGQQQPAPTG